MMPDEGLYILRRVSREFFSELVADAHWRGNLRSYIGYPETAQHVEKIAGVPIPVNRSATQLPDQALIAICKLKYRVADPGAKGRLQPDEEDYDYFVATYDRNHLRWRICDDESSQAA
jgi:phage-related protein